MQRVPPDGGCKRQSRLHCAYYTMSAKRHGIIGHQGGSGLRPRIALAIRRIITALRLLYHKMKWTKFDKNQFSINFKYFCCN
ncbi:hypothetical protein D3Z39_05915 [Anaerotruncus colihominis]|uniref:Uncharacterized protein n=1 Tax=Anaerotruncus colihominis TaxID=169435 RepID=A0A845REH4_9FIRM|nr:hypothetical protein [Anaerotruncus colihominis]